MTQRNENDASLLSASVPTRETTLISPSAPLRRPLFRRIWIAALVSNIGTWMQNVGAAWLMTELGASAFKVALVQAATNLPLFLLAIPAGALADIVDRRRLLLFAQAWMLIAVSILAVLTRMGWTTPWVLLLMTFLVGIGSALNAPAWQATIPELVPREEVPSAVALSGVSMNSARAVGPALGGLLIAASGAAATFAVNALSFVGVIVVLAAWRGPRKISILPAERFFGSMRAGLRYVRHAPELGAVILRAFLFVVGGSSLWALLPVIVSENPSFGPTHYGILLGFFGAGAVLGVSVLSVATRRLKTDVVQIAATVAFALILLTVAWLPHFGLWCTVLPIAGVCWLCAFTILNSTVQAVVPRWVRARALSVYLLTFFGGMSAGSMLWGDLANRFSAPWSLTGAAVWMLAGLLAAVRFPLPEVRGLALDPSRHWPEMPLPPEPDLDRGPLLVTIEYFINRSQSRAFVEVMRLLRKTRLRDGAVWCELFEDAAEPGRFVEVFLLESLVAHLRQHERVTQADHQIQERAKAFHRGDSPPQVTHLIAGEIAESPPD